MESFRAIALQVRCDAVNSASNRDDAMVIVRATIERLSKQIVASIAFGFYFHQSLTFNCCFRGDG